MGESIASIMQEPPGTIEKTEGSGYKVRDTAKVSYSSSSRTYRSDEEKRALLAEYDSLPWGERTVWRQAKGLSNNSIDSFRIQLQRGPARYGRRTDNEKRAILEEYDTAPYGERSKVLLREGISSGTMAKWREALGGTVISYVPGSPAEASANLNIILRDLTRAKGQRNTIRSRVDDLRERLEAGEGELKEISAEISRLNGLVRDALADEDGE